MTKTITQLTNQPTPTGADLLAMDKASNGVTYNVEIRDIHLGMTAASDTVASVVELATNAEVSTGTDTSRAVTPASLKYINKLRNIADSITSVIQNAATVARTWTIVNRDAELGNPLNNYSVAAQAVSATTRTYITGSAITVPADGFRIGTIITWRFNMTKTAAGSAASTFDIAFGTNGTTADTARVSFTKPGGSGVVDEALVEIEMVVRGPITSTGVVSGHFKLSHNLNATGHATISNVNVHTISAAFDLTVASTIVGICITTGASDAITIEQVITDTRNL